MAEMGRTEAVLGILTLCLAPLHLLSIIFNGVFAMGYGNDSLWFYVLTGGYMLIVLGTDCFMLSKGKFGLSRALRKYWGSSVIVSALAVLLTYVPFPPIIDGAGIGGLLMLYTPFLMVVPAMGQLGFSTNKFWLECGCAAAFCLVNWAVCRFLLRSDFQGTAYSGEHPPHKTSAGPSMAMEGPACFASVTV